MHCRRFTSLEREPRDARVTELTTLAQRWVEVCNDMAHSAERLLVIPETPEPGIIESHKRSSESAIASGKVLVEALKKEELNLPSPYAIKDLEAAIWKLEWDYQTWHCRKLSDSECEGILEAAFPSHEE